MRHAIDDVVENKVDVILTNFLNKPQTLPAGFTVAFGQPMDNQCWKLQNQKLQNDIT